MKNVIIRIGPDAPEQIWWAESAVDDGAFVAQEGSLADFAKARGRQRVTVLVPAASVLLIEAPLPPGSRKRALKAIPFVLEERLASNVEDLHFAYGVKLADGTIPVAVVSHDLMRFWLEMFQQAGIEVDSIIPETLALPFEPAGWSVMVAEDSALVRTGPVSGYAVDAENLEAMLLAGLQDAAALGKGKEVRIELYGGSVQAFADPLLRSYLVQKAGRLMRPSDGLKILADGLATRPTTLNLLQGNYGPHAEWSMVWKRWHLPVALLCALVVLKAGLLVYDVVRLGYESRELSRQMDQIYLKTFPDAKKVVNARAQMEQRLNALAGSANNQDIFLSLLARCADTLLKTPGFELESMRYKDGRVEIDFAVRDLQTLDSTKTLLMSEAGLEVEIRTASAKGERVSARMLIKGKGL